MSSRETQIKKCKEVAAQFTPRIVGGAIHAYLDALQGAQSPGPADIKAATHAAEKSMMDALLAAECRAALGLTESTGKEHLQLLFAPLRPVLALAPPPVKDELTAFQFGMAGLVGAALGMTVMAPFTRFVLGTGEVGLLVGGPLGAFGLIVAVWHAAHRRSFRRLLLGLLAVGTLHEAISFVTGRGGLLRLWRYTQDRGSSLKRVGVYCATLLLVTLATPRLRLDRGQYECILHAAFTQWVEAAVLMLGYLGTSGPPVPSKGLDESQTLQLAEKVLKLSFVSPEALPDARDELLQHLRNMGFDAGSMPQTLTWSAALADRYNAFGHVEPGDVVTIERDAVIHNGVVRIKGLVRRFKRSAAQ